MNHQSDFYNRPTLLQVSECLYLISRCRRSVADGTNMTIALNRKAFHECLRSQRKKKARRSKASRRGLMEKINYMQIVIIPLAQISAPGGKKYIGIQILGEEGP